MEDIHDIITEINRIADEVWQVAKVNALAMAPEASGRLKIEASRLHDVRRRLTELYVEPVAEPPTPSPARLDDGLREWDT